MAYDTQEERLKVQGSEQITRDLKVNRDAYINGSLNASGDIDIQGQVIARDDVSISGDLYVNGTEYINDSETSQTSDNYLVLRHNKTTALGNNEHAGIAVHNYSPNKTATCTVDNQGTWRVADNTETSTVYTNVSYFNGVYYADLTTTTTTVANGIKTAWDEDELDECVYYSTSYYHFDGDNWFTVGLSNNILTVGAQVTDATTITALEALTRNDLVYFRSLTITAINEIENEPLLTRDESTNLQNKDLLTWDSTAQKAVAASRATADDQALVWKSGNYEWKGITDTVASGSSDLVTSNGVANAIGTLDAASAGGSGKYISEISESDGIISATEGNIDTTVTSGSNNPVSSDAVANAINALDVASVGGNNKYIKAISETDGKISATEGTVDTTVTQNSSNLITSGAVYSAVQSITPQTVVDSVTVGDMNPVTSNAVALAIKNSGGKITMDDLFPSFSNYGKGQFEQCYCYDNYIFALINNNQADPSCIFGLSQNYSDDKQWLSFALVDNKLVSPWIACIKDLNNDYEGDVAQLSDVFNMQYFNGYYIYGKYNSSYNRLSLYYTKAIKNDLSGIEAQISSYAESWIVKKGVFVYANESGVYSKTDNPEGSFTQRISSGHAHHLCYGNGMFACIVDGYIYKSTDGISWSNTNVYVGTTDTTYTWIAFGKKFCYYNANTKYIYYSTDLSNWTAMSSFLGQIEARFVNPIYLGRFLIVKRNSYGSDAWIVNTETNQVLAPDRNANNYYRTGYSVNGNDFPTTEVIISPQKGSNNKVVIGRTPNNYYYYILTPKGYSLGNAYSNIVQED